jgi:glycosyltransferase involved in cell wall biosynthesis
MRIAFITTMTTAPWGGSEALWAETVHRALDAGHEVFVSVYGWPTTPQPVEELMRRGAYVERRRLSRRWRRSGILMRLFNPFRALRKFRPDAVLISQGGTYDISRGKEFKQLRRALLKTDRWPYVLLCHCEQDPPRRERAKQRARDAFKGARIIGMLSHDLRAKSERQLSTSITNVRLFQNPLNVRSKGPLPWPGETSLRLAFVGRLEWIKGLDLAIEVFSSPVWRGRDWRIDVYGSGELQSQYEAQVAALGLSERIRFCGFASDMDAVWREHHVLLLPSRAEGVPNSMLEAMLCGRPVLVSNVGGISAWVDDGETGYILPQPTAAELAAAMERLWNDRHRLAEMGAAAYQRTLRRRDPDPALSVLRWLEEVGGVATDMDRERAEYSRERSSSRASR